MKSNTIIAAWFAIIGAAVALDARAEQNELSRPGSFASIYAVDFVATAAFGADMNEAGDIVGTSYPDPGCGSSCLPPLETVVWKNGIRTVLPDLAGFSGATVNDINNKGWVCGFAGLFGFGHAAAWKPNGNSYTPIDMGVLPGTSSSNAIGLDDSNRAVGYSTATSGFETPFLWTEAVGITNLVNQGFPNERPLGISPGGKVATIAHWYDLGDPASVMTMPPAPRGLLLENSSVAINDAGDQARFLVTASGQILDYPFRFHHEGTYQQISFVPTGHLSSYGVGSINAAQDVTATVQSTAMIGAGPDGLLQELAPLVSPAYSGSVLTSGGPMNASGEILARMIIGQTGQRLVKLAPTQPCTTNCIEVKSIRMKGQGSSRCDQGTNQVQAQITVTNESGAPLAGVTVTGHFLDDYWLDELVSGVTNSRGQVKFRHIGPPCVGGVAFLVTEATSTPARTFDRTTGVLSNYIIPQTQSESP